jgi:hypothetical protein
VLNTPSSAARVNTTTAQGPTTTAPSLRPTPPRWTRRRGPRAWTPRLSKGLPRQLHHYAPHHRVKHVVVDYTCEHNGSTTASGAPNTGCAPAPAGSAPFSAAGTPRTRTPQAHELCVRVGGSTEWPHHPPLATRWGHFSRHHREAEGTKRRICLRWEREERCGRKKKGAFWSSFFFKKRHRRGTTR